MPVQKKLLTLVLQTKREDSLGNKARLMLELRTALMTPLAGSLGSTRLTLDLTMVPTMQRPELMKLHRTTKQAGSLGSTRLTPGQKRVLRSLALLTNMEGNWDNMEHLNLYRTRVLMMQRQEPMRLRQTTKLVGNCGNKVHLMLELKKVPMMPLGLRTRQAGS